MANQTFYTDYNAYAYERMAWSHLWRARRIRDHFIHRNPERYDCQQARDALTYHVRQARQCNHASLRIWAHIRNGS